MKILHLADLHIDAGFSDRNLHLAQRVYEIKFSMLDEILKFIKEESVDLLVIAGDLYDSQNPPKGILYRVDKWLCDLLEMGLFVLYVNGNHDYWVNRNSFLHASRHENFFCICEANYVQKKICIHGEDVVFHAFGYDEPNPYTKVISHFQPKRDECVHIGVLHAVVEGMFTKDKAPYYPIDKIQLDFLDYDYFALGHIHRSLDVNEKCAYSGGFYPRYYEDYASYGGVAVDIKFGQTYTKRVQFTTKRIVNLQFKMGYEAKLSNYDELLNHLIHEHEILKCRREDDFLNIKLEGILFFDWEKSYKNRLKEDLFFHDAHRHRLECDFKMAEKEACAYNDELSSLFDEAFQILIAELKRDEENAKNILKTGNMLLPISSQIELFEKNKENIKDLAMNMMGEENVD